MATWLSPALLPFSLSAAVLAAVFTLLIRLFRREPTVVTESKPSPVRALPASWYTSQNLYNLERRAIFSKRWLLTTHKARLPNPGDWLQYEVAGFNFVVSKDRTGAINAFHNVCRHRAFPVVTQEKGNSSFLTCKYHNWTYGVNGQLTKAPKYEELDGFNKSENGLIPIHVHIDTNGFIWVNLDGAKAPPPWIEDFGEIDQQPRFKAYKWDEYVFDHTWEMEGEYNWKILADNYNECYHCPSTHPDIPKIADLSSYAVRTEKCYVQHLGNPTAEQIAKGFNVAATYYYPNASMNVSPHFFFIQRFLPKGPNKSVMSYEVFRNKNSSQEDFEVINDMYKRIMSEDKYLCTNAQKNIEAGVFINGELHPRMEQGPLFFQNTVREAVITHHKQEEKERGEIWPTRQILPSSATGSKDDMAFCSTLDCSKAKGLDW